MKRKCWICKTREDVNISFSPPAAFYDNPCSNHGHQRVERVDLTGGDCKKEAEQQRGALLHMGTWNAGGRTELFINQQLPWGYKGAWWLWNCRKPKDKRTLHNSERLLKWHSRDWLLFLVFGWTFKVSKILTEVTEEESNRNGHSENSQVHKFIGRHCCATMEKKTSRLVILTHKTNENY